MADSLVGIDIEGIEPLMKKLEKMPAEVGKKAGDDVAKYMLNVVQAYPPQKRVTRKQAYGKTFFSEKQRRWFFAALNSGAITIPYKRTQGFRRGWQKIGSGLQTIIVNSTSYGHFLVGENRQSRMMTIIGWKKMSQVVKERSGKISVIANAAVKKGLKDMGL